MSNTVVGALGASGVDMSVTEFKDTFPDVVDPIAAAYIEINGSDAALSEGAALYWSTGIAVELGENASPKLIKERMKEHIEFANDKEAVKKFEGSSAGQSAIAESKKTINALTGVSDYAALDSPCGMGQKDPLAQSFYVRELNGIFASKVDLYFGS